MAFFYSEVEGIGVNFVRYSDFLQREILPKLGNPKAFYDEQGNLKPEYQQNMQRLREWAADNAVTVLSAKCLLNRFESPKAAGPSCRPDFGAVAVKGWPQ